MGSSLSCLYGLFARHTATIGFCLRFLMYVHVLQSSAIHKGRLITCLQLWVAARRFMFLRHFPTRGAIFTNSKATVLIVSSMRHACTSCWPAWCVIHRSRYSKNLGISIQRRRGLGRPSTKGSEVGLKWDPTPY